jgi:hypothetical protein
VSRRTSRRAGSVVSTRVAAQEGFVGLAGRTPRRPATQEGFVQKVLLKEGFVQEGFVVELHERSLGYCVSCGRV